MRSRVRGRRVAWLLASALPLIAQDDVSASENLRLLLENEQPNSVDHQQESVMELSTPLQHSSSSIHHLTRRKESSSLRTNSNETTRLRKGHSWSSPLAVHEHDHHTNHEQQLWKEFTADLLQTREHSFVTNILGHTSGFSENDDTCPRMFVWNASTTTDQYLTKDALLKPTQQNITESLPTGSDSPLSTQHDQEETAVKADAVTDTHKDTAPSPVEEAKRLFRVDYASKSAGALVLESSEHFQGTSNLLTNDQDAYAIIPCEEPNKSVVIGLSEDILVKQVVLANYERYSSHVKTFRVQGSMTMGNWRDFGTFTATRKGQTSNTSHGKQTFELQKPAWARYLKFEFLTHHGNEYYCTVSQISVHGSTMLQGFHEQWEETNQEEVQNTELVKPVDTLPLVEISDMDPIIASCVTPLHSQCPILLDFAAVAASYSSSNALSTAHVASIRLLSRFKVQTHTPQRYSSLQRIGRMSLIPKQRICTTSNPQMETMKKGVWSLVDRRDAPHIVTIRKLLTSIGMEPDELVDDIVVKLVDTREEVNAVTSDKIISDRIVNERHPVKPVIHEARKEEKEEVAQKLEPPQEHSIIVDSVSSTDMMPEQVDYFAETGIAFAKALERLPSSRCLLDLDFPSFKTKFANSKIAGSGSNGNAQVNSSPMEPIFKKLTDEIKALQASVSIHDLYAKESIICYQRVVMELMIEMESTRRDQEARLFKLEQESRRNSPFVFLAEVWRWIFNVGHVIAWWALDMLRSIGALLFPSSMLTFPWIETLTDPMQPYLTELSCSMLRYIYIGYDSITACFMLPGTTTQLSLPYFCKL